MTRFDRYILKQLLALFGFFTLLLVAIYWVNRAVSVFEQLIADGQTAWVFVELTALSLPYVVSEVAPVSAFAAAVYVANRMVTESEIVVMQATGFSAFRLARAPIIYGLLVAALMALILNALVPASRIALADRQAAITADVTARFLKDGEFQFPTPGITVFVGRVAPDGELQDIYLSDAREPDRRMTYTARSALLSTVDGEPKLLLVNGMVTILTLPAQRLSVTRFKDFTYDLGAALSSSVIRSRDAGALPTAMLLNPSQEVLDLTRQTRTTLVYRGHHRLSQPFFATAAALIGFATLLLGAFSRLGLWRQLLIAAVLLVGVYMIGNTAESVGVRSEGFWFLAWVGPLTGCALGVALLWLAQRPRLRARNPFAVREVAA